MFHLDPAVFRDIEAVIPVPAQAPPAPQASRVWPQSSLGAEPREAASPEQLKLQNPNLISTWECPSSPPAPGSWDLTVLSQPVSLATASQHPDLFPGFPHPGVLPRVTSHRAFSHAVLPKAEVDTSPSQGLHGWEILPSFLPGQLHSA